MLTTPTPAEVTLILPAEGSGCCCQFVIEGDILTEDLVDSAAECVDRDGGQCTDPTDRIAPHPCCPEVAAGGRCP
jgi:hypothetical protein